MVVTYQTYHGNGGGTHGFVDVFTLASTLKAAIYLPVSVRLSDCIWLVPTWQPPTPEPEA